MACLFIGHPVDLQKGSVSVVQDNICLCLEVLTPEMNFALTAYIIFYVRPSQIHSPNSVFIPEVQ